MDFKQVHYFTSKEFDSPDSPGSGENMQPTFIDKLNRARHSARIPFVINSGYRTKDHNKEVGGKANSAHLKGWAADIKVANSSDRFVILRALILAGFTRIGIAETFIHVDSDPTKAQPVIWTY